MTDGHILRDGRIGYSSSWMAYICTLKKFKRQHKPGPGDEGDVEEANEVSKQSGDQHLQI